MNIVADMLLSEPAPLAIWATLMLLTLPALLVLGSPDGVRRPRRALREAVEQIRERGERRRQRQQEAVQAVRYAEEVRAAAGRAAHAAELWRARWEQTEQARTDAWTMLVAAESRLRRSQGAAAFGTPWTPQTPTEYASRERFLHQAVRGAAARGELPPAAVADALTARAGWDPRLHPVDQELAVHRAAVAHLRQHHARAAEAERTAWHDAQLAARTRDSLRTEVATAEVTAAGLRPLLPAARPPSPAARSSAPPDGLGAAALSHDRTARHTRASRRSLGPRQVRPPHASVAPQPRARQVRPPYASVAPRPWPAPCSRRRARFGAGAVGAARTRTRPSQDPRYRRMARTRRL